MTQSLGVLTDYVISDFHPDGFHMIVEKLFGNIFFFVRSLNDN